MRVICSSSLYLLIWRLIFTSLVTTSFIATVAAQLPVLQTDNYPPLIREQIRRFHRAAQDQPGDANAVGKLGMILHAYEEFEAAVQCYERARSLAPDEFRWVYFTGVAQSRLGHAEKATASLQIACKLNPEYPPASVKLADILFDLKQNEAAEALYREVIKKNSASAFAWYGLGRVKAAQKDVLAAAGCFERAIAISPQFGSAHYALALALRDARNLSKAQEHLALYQKYRLVRPASDDLLLGEITVLNLRAEVFLNKGLALEAEGDVAGSIAAHEQALAINPNLTQTYINLIQLYGRNGQPDKAEEQYHRVVALNPGLADAHYNYGVLSLAQQKPQRAVAAFTRAVEINPNYTEAHHNLGLLLLQMTRLSEAAQEFHAALAANPNFRAAHFELGRILVHQQKLEEAISHFRQTLTPEDQETPRYLYALAATCIRAGKRLEGRQLLQRAGRLAVTFGQKELLVSIDRDLKFLESDK